MAVNNPTPARAGGHPETAILTFPPLVHVIFGFVLLFVFTVGCIMSMQTSEAWLLSIPGASLAPDFAILAQFPQFFSGGMDKDTTIAFVFAFIVQMVLLTSKIGLTSVHARVAQKHGIPPTEAMIKSARSRIKVWTALSILTLTVNAIADFEYSSHLGFFQSLFFSGVMFAATYYLGTFGIQNVTAGMSHM